MARFDVNDYVDTQTRINEFWSKCEDEKLNGFIHTEMLSDPNVDMYVVIKATVGYFLDGGIPLIKSSGIASEVRSYPGEAGGNFVNQTSWVENCETSAIGRAFANWGYATSGAERPSREEMEKVERFENAAASQSTGTASSYTPARQAQPRQAQGRGYHQPQRGGSKPQSVQNPDAQMTDAQKGFIERLAKGQADSIAYAMFEVPFAQINRGQASEMIQELKDAQERNQAQQEEVIIDDDHQF